MFLGWNVLNILRGQVNLRQASSRKNVTVKRLRKILLLLCFLMNGIVNSDVRFDIKGEWLFNKYVSPRF